MRRKQEKNGELTDQVDDSVSPIIRVIEYKNSKPEEYTSDHINNPGCDENRQDGYDQA